MHNESEQLPELDKYLWLGREYRRDERGGNLPKSADDWWRTFPYSPDNSLFVLQLQYGDAHRFLHCRRFSADHIYG